MTGWDVTPTSSSARPPGSCSPSACSTCARGGRAAEDWLPDRFLTEPLELESGRSATLTPERLRAMIDGYYDGRDLDADGLPSADRLEALGLDALVR